MLQIIISTLAKTIMATIFLSMIVCATIILSITNFTYKPLFNTSNEVLTVISNVSGMIWESLKIALDFSPIFLFGYLILTVIDVVITRNKEYNNRYKNRFKEKV